jgi:hypothetical protein
LYVADAGLDSARQVAEHPRFPRRILAMPDEKNDIGRILKRELLLAAGLVLAGILVLPAAVYGVGLLIFGEYPDGPAGFYREIWSALAAGNAGTWFLALSPWLVVTAVRLTWRGIRRPRSGSPRSRTPA